MDTIELYQKILDAIEGRTKNIANRPMTDCGMCGKRFYIRRSTSEIDNCFCSKKCENKRLAELYGSSISVAREERVGLSGISNREMAAYTQGIYEGGTGGT